MRRVTTRAAVLSAAAALALTATGCGATSAQSSGTPPSAGRSVPRVGMAYDVGGRGDHSFNDSAARGLDRAVREFGGAPKELTARTGDTEADREQYLSDLATAGYDPVIAVGFAYAGALKAVAPTFPGTTFGIVDSDVADRNVDSMTFATPESSYLAGAAAALTSTTGRIGFIGGVDDTLIRGFQAGFDQGVHDTRPGDRVTDQYLATGSDLSGFSSPDRGAQAAAGMLAHGVDVVYAAAGSSGTGSIETVAAQPGAWAIGVDSDQWRDPALAGSRHAILTSAVKNVDVAVFDLVRSVRDGRPLVGDHRYDLADGGVALATSGGHLAAIEPRLTAVERQITSGRITVRQTP